MLDKVQPSMELKLQFSGCFLALASPYLYFCSEKAIPDLQI